MKRGETMCAKDIGLDIWWADLIFQGSCNGIMPLFYKWERESGLAAIETKPLLMSKNLMLFPYLPQICIGNNWDMNPVDSGP